MTDEKLVSAQIIFWPLDGEPVDAATIDSKNVADYEPDPESIEFVETFLKKQGFSVDKVVGISCAITAKLETFERVFKTSVSTTDEQGSFFGSDDEKIRELKRTQVPKPIREFVCSVVFAPPPDYGPSSFH